MPRILGLIVFVRGIWIEIGHWMGAIFVARKPNGDGRDEKPITNTEAIWEFEGKI
jgi:hypothetical protein